MTRSKSMRGLATACCAASMLTSLGCEPSWKDRSGWLESPPGPSGVEEVLAAAREYGPCGITPWGGWIEWYDGPFDCGGAPAAGCYPGYLERSAHVQIVGRPYFSTAMASALPHEICHYLLDRCDGDAGHSAAHQRCTEAVTARAWEFYDLAHP